MYATRKLKIELVWIVRPSMLFGFGFVVLLGYFMMLLGCLLSLNGVCDIKAFACNINRYAVLMLNDKSQVERDIQC